MRRYRVEVSREVWLKEIYFIDIPEENDTEDDLDDAMYNILIDTTIKPFSSEVIESGDWNIDHFVLVEPT